MNLLSRIRLAFGCDGACVTVGIQSERQKSWYEMTFSWFALQWTSMPSNRYPGRHAGTPLAFHRTTSFTAPAASSHKNLVPSLPHRCLCLPLRPVRFHPAAHDLHRARYRTLVKVWLQCYFTAAAVNIKRWIALLSWPWTVANRDPVPARG